MNEVFEKILELIEQNTLKNRDSISLAIPIRYWQNRLIKNDESEQKLKEMESK